MFGNFIWLKFCKIFSNNIFARLELLPDCQVRNYCGGCQGGAFGAAPFGVLVVFHLVRIYYVFGAFPGPCWTPMAPGPRGNYGLRGNYDLPHLYSGFYSVVSVISQILRVHHSAAGFRGCAIKLEQKLMAASSQGTLW